MVASRKCHAGGSYDLWRMRHVTERARFSGLPWAAALYVGLGLPILGWFGLSSQWAVVNRPGIRGGPLA